LRCVIVPSRRLVVQVSRETGEAPDRRGIVWINSSQPEPHVSSYPVPSCAVPVSAGMVVAVPAELLASPLKSGRNLGDADRSAVVIGGTERIRTCGAVVFCKVVAVAGAQVRRDGQVRAKGSPVHHATLGPLEERLESQAGPGAIGGSAGRAPRGARFVEGQPARLLARGFTIRVIGLMKLQAD